MGIWVRVYIHRELPAAARSDQFLEGERLSYKCLCQSAFVTMAEYLTQTQKGGRSDSFCLLT